MKHLPLCIEIKPFGFPVEPSRTCEKVKPSSYSPLVYIIDTGLLGSGGRRSISCTSRNNPLTNHIDMSILLPLTWASISFIEITCKVSFEENLSWGESIKIQYFNVGHCLVTDKNCNDELKKTTNKITFGKTFCVQTTQERSFSLMMFINCWGEEVVYMGTLTKSNRKQAKSATNHSSQFSPQMPTKVPCVIKHGISVSKRFLVVGGLYSFRKRWTSPLPKLTTLS